MYDITLKSDAIKFFWSFSMIFGPRYNVTVTYENIKIYQPQNKTNLYNIRVIPYVKDLGDMYYFRVFLKKWFNENVVQL